MSNSKSLQFSVKWKEENADARHTNSSLLLPQVISDEFLSMVSIIDCKGRVDSITIEDIVWS